MNRLLVVSFVSPHPVNSGGARDIFSRLCALQSAGFEVDLIITSRTTVSSESIQQLERVVSTVRVVERERNPINLLSLKPFQYETRQGLLQIKLNHSYSAVLVESEFVGGILDNPTLVADQIVLRVHNDESGLYKALAHDASSIIERVLFTLEGWKFARYTPEVITRSDRLWFISGDELLRFRTKFSAILIDKDVSLLPSIIDPSSFRKPSLTSSIVFYVGALYIPVNQRGVIWYLENIHPQMLSNANYELVLAGQTRNGKMEPLLKCLRVAEKVRFLPDAAELTEIQNSAAAFINPIRGGAGLKIKTIDAAAAGLPIVTTSVGAEGTNMIHGVHAEIADNAAEFTASLRRILNDKSYAHSLVDAAQEMILRENNPEKAQELIMRLKSPPRQASTQN